MIDVLEDRQRGSFQSKDFLTKQINLLTVIAPSVFKVISTMHGPQLKILNKKVLHHEMRDKIITFVSRQI